jgi:hypothetical protein
MAQPPSTSLNIGCSMDSVSVPDDPVCDEGSESGKADPCDYGRIATTVHPCLGRRSRAAIAPGCYRGWAHP